MHDLDGDEIGVCDHCGAAYDRDHAFAAGHDGSCSEGCYAAADEEYYQEMEAEYEHARDQAELEHEAYLDALYDGGAFVPYANS